VSNLLDKPFLDSADFAKVLCTNDSVIRKSRGTGVLFGLPSPKWRRRGSRKILYEREAILAYLEAWKESSPELRITDAPEPGHLVEAREG
jgi:hypothetical protein